MQQKKVDSLNLARCDLIKIDVEGAEYGVLVGAGETIKRCQPVLYIEADRDLEKQQVMLEQLEVYGYMAHPHVVPLYSKNNYYGNADNQFVSDSGEMVSNSNFICAPMDYKKKLTIFDAERGQITI